MAKIYDAVLKLNSDPFVKGLEKAAEHLTKFDRAYQDVGKSFWKAGGSMLSAGQTLTKGITAPFIAGATAGVKAYADMEQAIGGIETLFGNNADVVIANSESAYKRAGVSGTAYMEQVTSFSASLLQGLNGDTVAAAKLADTAMVDMSDNANKFGTDIGLIQNAYQGFAKSNFTMLDNLRLGYGGTQEEMARLINDSGVMGDNFVATAKNVKDIPFDKMIEGIHVVQDKLKITGTTALEATETVAGSFGMMKSSLFDFMAGLGSKDANIGQLTKNLLDATKVFVGNVKDVLGTMWDNLPIPNWAKVLGGFLVSAGPLLMGFGLMNKGIGKVLFKFADLGKGIKTAGGVMKFLNNPLLKFNLVAAVVIGAIILIIKNWDKIKAKAEQIFPGIGAKFANMGQNLKLIAGAIVGFMTQKFGAFKLYFSAVWNALSPIVMIAFQRIRGLVNGFFTILDGLIQFIAGVFTGNWSKAWEGVQKIFSSIATGIKSIWGDVINSITRKINGFISLINQVKIPDWIPLVGGKGFNIPNIPTLEAKATGTDYWKGGLVQVHERGGEIIDLPRGGRIMPHDESIREAYEMGRGGKQNVSNTNLTIPKLADQIIIREDADIDRLVAALYAKLKWAKLNRVEV